MADNFGGIAKFTAALSGRDRIRQAAEGAAWRDAKAQAEGRIKADEFNQRLNLGDALVAGGVDPKDAAVISSVYRSGAGNFQQGTRGLGNLVDLATTRQAVDIANSENPDLQKLNALIASRITGGGPLSPQQANVVPLGEAMVASEQAQAGQRQALGEAALTRAGAAVSQSNARTDLLNRTNPNLRSVRSGSTLQAGPVPPQRVSSDLPLGEAMGGVGDIGPEEQTFVVTEDTGPAGIPLGQLPKFNEVRTGALQALDDARRAVSTGRITKEAARKRLIEAGFKNVAGRL